MFALFNLIILIILAFIDAGISIDLGYNTGILGLLYTLAILIPAIAVGVRRLHDSGKTGWLMLLVLLPILGSLILLILFVLDSEPGMNQYGPNPREVPAGD